MLDAFDGYSPALAQAEAYRANRIWMIDNGRTRAVVDATRRLAGPSLATAENPAAFFAAVAPAVAGRDVIVALGDSNTANRASWPAALLADYPEALVLNLADWSTALADHGYALQYALNWLRRNEAGEVRVAALGGLLDAVFGLSRFGLYLQDNALEPGSPSERMLARHRLGAGLARLLARPAIGVPDKWIARRLIATARIFEGLCAEQDAAFVFALQPLGYTDLAPGHAEALRAAHLTSGSSLDLERWLSTNGYHRTPSDRFGYDLRGCLDQVRELGRGFVLDLADLLQDAPAEPFNSLRDAVHYSGESHRMIAAAIGAGLRQARPCHVPVSPAA